MSAFLGLRDWLEFSDAARYVEGFLGTHHANLSDDFLLAYVGAGYPLEIGGGFYWPDSWECPTGDEEPIQYPESVCGIRYGDNGSILNDNETMRFERNMENLLIPETTARRGASLKDQIWIPSPFYQTGETSLIYQLFDEDPLPYLSALRWGDLAGGGKNYAVLSREHIDKLIGHAMGKPSSEPNVSQATQPEPEPLSLAVNHIDPEYVSYPPELHAAILLWEALYLRGEKSPHHSHTQAAKLWLEKNLDALPTAGQSNHGSNVFRKRLVTVTSPSARKPRK